jgi:hypothetical protein
MNQWRSAELFFFEKNYSTGTPWGIELNLK